MPGKAVTDVAMTLPSSWRELPRPNKAVCPKLFYNFSPQKESFALRLTDLVAIWECALSRTEIVEAARAQRTSIDPGESEAQLRVLLERLQQSLQSGNNHLFRAQDPSVETLFLETSLELPRPLKPLSWRFELAPQDTSELAEQLLRPCLHEASVAKQKLDSLLRVIKDKDHVLSRLLEKIESSQIDLSLIFPGITGLRTRRGGVTVKEAAKHVPGVGAFDLEKWETGFDNSSPYAGFDQKGMLNLVAGCEKCPKHTTKQHNNWLKALDVREVDDANNTSFASTQSLKRKASEVSKDSTPSDSESDFDRQPTPPHLKKTGNAGKQTKDSGSSSSAGNSDGGSPRPAKRAKLGKVGGPASRNKSLPTSFEKSSSMEPMVSPPPEPKLTRTASKDERTKPATPDSETETATPSESEADNPPRPTTPPPPPQLPPPLPSSRHSSNKSPGKRKLGRLASHSSRTQSPSPPVEAGTSDHDLKSESTSPHKNRFSQLRKHRPLTSSPLSSPHHRPSKHGTESNDRPAPPTPSRRLGRLSRQTTQTYSESRSRSHSYSPSPNTKKNTQPEDLFVAGSKSDSETETETASAIDTDSEAEQHNGGGVERTKSTSHPPSSSTNTPVPNPELEAKKVETTEQAANRRREELKQRLNSNNAAAVRKKRKF